MLALNGIDIKSFWLHLFSKRWTGLGAAPHKGNTKGLGAAPHNTIKIHKKGAPRRERPEKLLSFMLWNEPWILLRMRLH